MSVPSPCAFLALPAELRLQIYAFALLSSSAITVSSAELVGAYPDIVYRLYGGSRTPLPGLPPNHEAVILPTYDASLLSVSAPRQIDVGRTSHSVAQHGEGLQHDRGVHPLLLVNRQIHNDLKGRSTLLRTCNTSLFVSYPSGLHVLRARAPYLLGQVRSVHIAGTYAAKGFCNARGAFVPQPGGEPAAAALPDSARQLGRLLRTLLGPAQDPSARHAIEKFELRVYYPGPDSYASVWGDDCSPTVVALRNIYGGAIDVEVWRGRHGTGVYLSARPSGDGRRIVSTVWKRLEEGGRDEPPRGAWAVDARWPNWEPEYSGGRDGGKGQIVVS